MRTTSLCLLFAIGTCVVSSALAARTPRTARTTRRAARVTSKSEVHATPLHAAPSASAEAGGHWRAPLEEAAAAAIAAGEMLEGGPLPGWAALGITTVRDPAVIRELVGVLAKEHAQVAAMILPFAISSEGRPFGVASGTAPLWSAAMKEHGLEP